MILFEILVKTLCEIKVLFEILVKIFYEIRVYRVDRVPPACPRSGPRFLRCVLEEGRIWPILLRPTPCRARARRVSTSTAYRKRKRLDFGRIQASQIITPA